jgi:hypothetical protein
VSADNEVVINVIVERQVKAGKRAFSNGLIESETTDPTMGNATQRTADDAHNKEFAASPSRDKGTPIVGRRGDGIRYGTMPESWNLFDQFGMFQHLGIFPAPDQS